MAVKGKEKEVKNYSKYVGMFVGNVVAVNPTRTELEKILNTTIEKDPEYAGVSRDSGAKTMTLSFWLKEESQGYMFNVRFILEDTAVESKSGKPQFINSIGTTSYATDISQLPSWVTSNNRSIRKAMRGEELLYKFLRNWLSHMDYDDEDTELYVNWNHLINGRLDELKGAIEAFDDKKICALATVRTADDGKEYQGVYSYEFLPAFAMNCFTGEKAKNYKSVDRFIERVTDAEYGCKDFYILKPLEEYDPSKNIVQTTNSSIIAPAAPARIETSSPKSQPQPAEVISDEEDELDDLPF